MLGFVQDCQQPSRLKASPPSQDLPDFVDNTHASDTGDGNNVEGTDTTSTSCNHHAGENVDEESDDEEECDDEDDIEVSTCCNFKQLIVL